MTLLRHARSTSLCFSAIVETWNVKTTVSNRSPQLDWCQSETNRRKHFKLRSREPEHELTGPTTLYAAITWRAWEASRLASFNTPIASGLSPFLVNEYSSKWMNCDDITHLFIVLIISAMRRPVLVQNPRKSPIFLSQKAESVLMLAENNYKLLSIYFKISPCVIAHSFEHH